MGPPQLRALAHPLRLQLLQVLSAEGPATASQLGRRLGESSGATSYHLRALHRAGMVEDAEQRNGRERWWQPVPERLMIPNSVPPQASDEERLDLEAAHAQIESILVERDEKALQRWTAIRRRRAAGGPFHVPRAAARAGAAVRNVSVPPTRGRGSRRRAHSATRPSPTRSRRSWPRAAGRASRAPGSRRCCGPPCGR